MTTSVSANFQVRRSSPLIGAEIEGVDLTRPVDPAEAAALREAFWTYKVLVFRNQNLSALQQVEVVRIFDEPFDHPTRINRHADSRLVYMFHHQAGGRIADRWHIGGTWRNPPFHLESLCYQVVPELGGHTLWADLQAAYDDLSEPMKELLESVNVIYNAFPGAGDGVKRPITDTVEHPVVRAHRHTGRKGLILSAGAIGLTGVTEAEGQALLPFLKAHASSPNYTTGFGWKPGDFVIWDNLATWHYAVHDYDGPRVYAKVIGG